MSTDTILSVVFFLTNSGREPVREWLKDLNKADRKTIGEDIKLVQFRWPSGMPLVRKMEADLWEVRSRLSNGRIAHVLFTVKNGEMALLHGFIKKSQKTPYLFSSLRPKLCLGRKLPGKLCLHLPETEFRGQSVPKLNLGTRFHPCWIVTKHRLKICNWPGNKRIYR